MNRRGIALLLAVMALAVLGAVAATAHALAVAEARIGQSEEAEVQAAALAEGAVASAFTGWPRSESPSAPGDSLVFPDFAVAGQGRGWAVLRALGGPSWLWRGPEWSGVCGAGHRCAPGSNSSSVSTHSGPIRSSSRMELHADGGVSHS